MIISKLSFVPGTERPTQWWRSPTQKIPEKIRILAESVQDWRPQVGGRQTKNNRPYKNRQNNKNKIHPKTDTHTQTDRQKFKKHHIIAHHGTSWHIMAVKAPAHRSCSRHQVLQTVWTEINSLLVHVILQYIPCHFWQILIALFATFCNTWWWPSSVYQFLCQAGLKFEENTNKTSYVFDSICWHNIIAK